MTKRRATRPVDAAKLVQASINRYINEVKEPDEATKWKIIEALGIDPEECHHEAPIERLTVKEAAALMGVPQSFVKLGLEENKFDWGYAIQYQSGRWSYWINKKRFEEKEMIKIGGRL